MGPCRPEEQPVGKPSPFMKRRGPTLAGCGAIGAGFALPRDAGLETGAPGWALWHVGTGAGFALPRDAGLETGAPGWALWHVGTGAGFALPRDAGLKTGAPGWALRHVGSC